MAVRALVISLPSAAARRDMQSRQLDALGIGWGFLDATATADIPAADMARLERLWCRPLRPAEVACALSHRRAWDAVAAGDGPVLILEDDAILAPDTPPVLAALAGRPDLDCVTLETFTLAKRLGPPEPLGVGSYGLSKVYRDSGGAAAYLLWPMGARKALAGRPGYLPLADAAINLAPGLVKHQVEPACAIQAMFVAGRHPFAPEVWQTTVSPPGRVGIPSRRDWLRYKVRRLRVSAMLLGGRLRGLGRSSKRVVPFAGDL